MDWTGPADVRAQVQRAWDRGQILSARLTGASLFPMTVRMRRPETRDLSDRFDEVRQWIRDLETGSLERNDAGYEIVWDEVEFRQIGRNRIPAGILVPTEGDALQLIGKRRASERFTQLAELTLEAIPQLRDWLARKPHKVLDHAEAWPRIIEVVKWLRGTPRPQLYLRQLEIAGVDTKFIEARRSLFSELLDIALAKEAIDPLASSFEGRYGLLSKPTVIRFRILDPRQALSGLTDIATPLAELAAIEPPGRRVFITENEVNGLAFPPVPDSIVIFGLGYGVDCLSELRWLARREIHYWGDIDTHGFAMLDRARGAFPQTRSMLMDRETLLEHRALCVEEAKRHPGPLKHLTASEGELFDDLLHDRLGERVRLEQERISFGRVRAALNAIGESLL
jgi:hypothetical protein